MKLIATLLMLPSLAFAQAYTVKAACLPAVDTQSTVASTPWLRWNTAGVCVRWNCYKTTTTPAAGVTYCGTWAEQSKVGGRINTIQKAADPLVSLQTAGSRYTIVPMTDQSMIDMP